MGVGRWTHGRIADRSRVKREQGMIAQLPVVDRCYLHEEVMRVLAINDGSAERRFTLLKQLRVETVAYGCRLQAEHGPQCQLSRPKRALDHGHKPVCGEDLVLAARACLSRRVEEDFIVEHEHPVAPGEHDHRLRDGIRLRAGPRGFMAQNLVDEAAGWRLAIL